MVYGSGGEPPDTTAVIEDLAHGADGGASLLHLAVWLLGVATGTLSPIVLRAMSLACVVVALCLVYAVLRHRCSRDASVAGVLAAGSHSLVVGLMVAIAAAFLCTIHWYGVISLGLMTAAYAYPFVSITFGMVLVLSALFFWGAAHGREGCRGCAHHPRCRLGQQKLVDAGPLKMASGKVPENLQNTLAPSSEASLSAALNAFPAMSYEKHCGWTRHCLSMARPLVKTS